MEDWGQWIAVAVTAFVGVLGWLRAGSAKSDAASAASEARAANVLAGKANDLAHKANDIALEANGIAREANGLHAANLEATRLPVLRDEQVAAFKQLHRAVNNNTRLPGGISEGEASEWEQEWKLLPEKLWHHWENYASRPPDAKELPKAEDVRRQFNEFIARVGKGMRPI